MKFYLRSVLVTSLLFFASKSVAYDIPHNEVQTPWGLLSMTYDSIVFCPGYPMYDKMGERIEYLTVVWLGSSDFAPVVDWYNSNPSVVKLVPASWYAPSQEVWIINYGTALITATLTGTEYSLSCPVIVPFPDDYIHLKTLSIAGHAFSGGFHADTTVYSLTVPSSTDSINIAAEANTYPGVTVTGAGTKTLPVGDTIFPITVNSGSDEHADKTYTIKIHRKSNDASLKYFSANGSELPLDSFIHNFTVPNATQTFKIIAEANHSLATVSGDTGYKTLNVGDSTFTVTVTAEEGNTLTHTINIHRKSVDATLKAFTLTGTGNSGDIPFGFNPATLNYRVPVSNAVTGIEIAAAANYRLAAVSGDTGSKTLNVGDTTFTVTVTPEEGLPKAYTIHIHRKSIDATLKAFTLTDTRDNSRIPFDFNPAGQSYEIEVSHELRSIRIAAAANYPLSAVSGDTGNKTLNVGDNTVTVTVTPEEGQPITYTIHIHRKSIDVTLKSLTVGGQPVSSSFDPSKTDYSFAVENAVSGIRIDAVANYPLTTVTGAGNKTLNDGYNRFTVTVIPEEGPSGTYTVTVYRRSADDRLQSLTLSNPFNGSNIPMEYNHDKLTYTATVPTSLQNITLNARANYSAAFVTGHTGIQSLRPGRNIFHITVTAEDGTVKIHPVIITVVDTIVI